MLTNQEPWTKNCGTKLNWFYSPLLYYINVLVWKILNYIEASVVCLFVFLFFFFFLVRSLFLFLPMKSWNHKETWVLVLGEWNFGLFIKVGLWENTLWYWSSSNLVLWESIRCGIHIWGNGCEKLGPVLRGNQFSIIFFLLLFGWRFFLL